MLVLQLRWSGRTTEERDERIDEHVEGLVVRAHQEPVPDQGREDHAGHHHQDDADPGNNVPWASCSHPRAHVPLVITKMTLTQVYSANTYFSFFSDFQKT